MDEIKPQSQTWISPVIVYVVACILITLIQIAVMYFKFGDTPNIFTEIYNIICLIICAMIIYFLGSSNFAWVAAIFLLCWLFICCVSTISGSQFAKYTDPVGFIMHGTGTTTLTTAETTQEVK